MTSLERALRDRAAGIDRRVAASPSSQVYLPDPGGYLGPEKSDAVGVKRDLCPSPVTISA